MAAAVPSLGGTSLVSRSVTVRLDDSEGPLSPLSAGGTVPMDLDVKGEGPTTPHELHAGDFQAAVFAKAQNANSMRNPTSPMCMFRTSIPAAKQRVLAGTVCTVSIICFLLSSFATGRFQHF